MLICVFEEEKKRVIMFLKLRNPTSTKAIRDVIFMRRHSFVGTMFIFSTIKFKILSLHLSIIVE